MPGYGTINARIDFKGIGGLGLDLGLFARDITKEKYFTSPSVFSPNLPANSAIVGEPRTCGADARFAF